MRITLSVSFFASLLGSLLSTACVDALEPSLDEQEGIRDTELGIAAIATTAARSLTITAASVLQPCLTNAGLTACGPNGVSAFALDRTLGVMLRTAGTPTASPALFARQFWDTQNTIAGAQTAAANPQCNETTNGAGQATINGHPIQCARNEGSMAAAGINLFAPASPDYFYPIALVNRLDLRDAASTTCGEYRIIYGRKDAMPTAVTGRALLIFEAAFPNPRPALGADGCTPVAAMWANLSSPTVTAAAAQATLVNFFYVGTRFTYSDGVSVTTQPAMHFQNLGAVRGQVRSNLFMNGTNEPRWQLREFRTQFAGGVLRLRPVHVESNPWPGRFSAATGSDGFSTWFLGQLPNLIINDINGFFLADNVTFGAGQSDSQIGAIEGPTGDPTQFTNDYNLFASTALTNAVQARLNALGSTLTPVNIYNRATAMSCGGCHQHSNGDALGGGLGPWPASALFVHVDETPTTATAAPDAFGAAGRSFRISAALTNVFLPFRMSNLRCIAFDECAGLTASQSVTLDGRRSM